ncbi:MAG TPA: pentapeptide repeat-containing protein, partial [Pirellulales bacterium]|nr:pentapeptide repeat-containing protein [Pirellulales bacterium]
ALLFDCDLEYMRLPAANFERAQLKGAHLTGSQMPGACFHKANLRNTGLAEIDWDRADLRGADLTHCTFHLGSSRSGLVGSPIASEGSRTGFYTDEYLEQGFKSPEEIRKANLCGADLRGAEIDGVDFYLVDLRNARYTPEQEDHLRRCGAILEVRAE